MIVYWRNLDPVETTAEASPYGTGYKKFGKDSSGSQHSWYWNPNRLLDTFYYTGIRSNTVKEYLYEIHLWIAKAESGDYFEGSHVSNLDIPVSATYLSEYDVSAGHTRHCNMYDLTAGGWNGMSRVNIYNDNVPTDTDEFPIDIIEKYYAVSRTQIGQIRITPEVSDGNNTFISCVPSSVDNYRGWAYFGAPSFPSYDYSIITGSKNPYLYMTAKRRDRNGYSSEKYIPMRNYKCSLFGRPKGFPQWVLLHSNPVTRITTATTTILNISFSNIVLNEGWEYCMAVRGWTTNSVFDVEDVANPDGSGNYTGGYQPHDNDIAYDQTLYGYTGNNWDDNIAENSWGGTDRWLNSQGDPLFITENSDEVYMRGFWVTPAVDFTVAGTKSFFIM